MEGSKKYLVSILLILAILGGFSFLFGKPDFNALNQEDELTFELQDSILAKYDSLPLHYPVKKTVPTTYQDFTSIQPIDFETPGNIQSTIEYDPISKVYIYRTKVGDMEVATPFSFSQDEYLQHTLKKSMSSYFKKKNSMSEAEEEDNDEFSLKNIKLNIGPAERLFGPGGVKFTASGYVEAKMGIKHTTDGNPTRSERSRSRTAFDFDEDIQLNVQASVGDKINFDMNYDTQAMFDFDSKRIKLAYDASAAGDEDGILRRIEAGNVSMHTTNSLISGGSALFGIASELQFGKLRINSVISQQEAEARRAETKGGVQRVEYEFKVDEYDENRHFFIGHYFKDTYDKAMSKLPLILSGVNVEKIEVWVTNKRGDFNQSRNIVAFADLGESKNLKNDLWKPVRPTPEPFNEANTLYQQMVATNPSIRDIGNVTSVLDGLSLEGGMDYEKLENARLLSPSEYTFNPKLGYISLITALRSDEVLAVAYTYKVKGKTYQVGELSSEIVDKHDAGNPKSGALFVKLLKPTSLSPDSYTWQLMMKNVYSLGTSSIQREDFKLDIAYRSDTIGTYINYLPEGRIKNRLLLRVMGLDKLNAKEQARPDGVFDFVEGYTINSQTGRIYFPTVEPFGKNLRDSIGDDAIADKYVFQELYDETLTTARQVAEKNKYIIRGTYRGSTSDAEINLNTTNIPPGSVRVTAGGNTLVENVDYTVDYTAGIVTILNRTLLDSNTPIQASAEGMSFSMQRKTMMGINLNYDFSKNLTLGGTLMHYYEKPLMVKTRIGEEAVKNTLWGLNASYRTESMWLTNMVNKIPFVEATAPSQFNLNAEFAHMIPGHYQNSEVGGYAYLDDFETSEGKIDLKSPYAWNLASTPSSFEESSLTNKIEYGKNRAMMSWFIIDPLFTRKQSSLTPQHIKSDVDQLSNHYVREVTQNEIFPNRDIAYNQTATQSTLNISYYPEERGPYNIVASEMNTDGKLKNPKDRWGGITRRMDVRDFESSNVEYIEFWLMDPFVYNEQPMPGGEIAVPNEGGYLYFNLGDISEDVLKDGKKFYENGLPVNDDPSAVEETVWGKVPKRQSTVYAFDDSSDEARRKQDVGLNGLSTAEEFEFKAYKEYLASLRNILSGPVQQKMMDDPFSPFNDPAGDTYHFYRGSDYDREEKSILDRYKYYNNTEGNSRAAKDSGESYSTAARSIPDVEDIDQDYTLNEKESYFQYKIPLFPTQMSADKNPYIVGERTLEVPLRNGKPGQITWYQFKIPIREHDGKPSRPRDFKSIRFMRMFLTGFAQPTFLRFGTLQLVRGEWRVYDRPLNEQELQGAGTIDVSTINIEEHGADREPVNYVLPPGLSRDLSPDQAQLTKENEQSLSMKITKLESGDAKAIYKSLHYDMRRYKKLQLFTHLEEMINETSLIQGDMSIFIRLGSDYKNNYYEYEIPMSVTPHGRYSSRDSKIVWPVENMFDFRLEHLKNVKLSRNKEMRRNKNITYLTPFFEYDPDKRQNRITVVGNPSLSDVSVIMVGVKNNSHETKSGEIWINELRLTDFDEEGGWAAQANMNVALSDLATISFAGRKETSGFGALEQSLMERRQDDYEMYNIATSVDLGRFIPKAAKVSIPFNYTYSKETITPKYDPFDQDVTIDESLKLVDTKAEKDSIKSLARDQVTAQSINFSNVRVNIASKTPMPYDPANFSFSYGQNKSEINSPSVVHDKVEDYRAGMSYSYSPVMKTWEPFKKMKGRSGSAKFARSLGFNYLPNNISFNSIITRHYTETILRDIESYRLGAGAVNQDFLSFTQEFYWDRDFSLNWDFTRNLKFSFQSGTRAEIEEPYLQVNKKMNRNAYETWRDEVWKSIKNLGTPLAYRQTSSLTYQLPFRNIPALNWINNSTISYNSGYNWDRGAAVDTLELGNTISNQMTLEFANRFNLVNLYNKSPFLKRVNERFEDRKRPTTAQKRQQEKPEKKKRRFKQTIILREDTTTTIRHNLNTKNLEVIALNNRKKYSLKFKKVDENTIMITNKDTATVVLDIGEKEPREMAKWLVDLGEYSARGLMSVRSLNVNYSTRNESYIAGFRPMIGAAFGQGNTQTNGYAPGLGFAFGFQGGEDYVEKSLRKDWLVKNEININPAIYNESKKLNIRAELVPFKGMRIELTAAQERNKRTEIQYMFAGSPKTLGGSYSISTIALASSFSIGKAENNYHSSSFQKFLDNREHIQRRLEQRYSNNAKYPSGGFMEDIPGLIGDKYDPTVGAVNPNSPDVLIPAFIAAYTGKDVNKVSLSAFPSLSSILPNWSVRYDGLSNLPFLKDHVKSIELLHGYQSFYQVGGYNSHSSWLGAGSDDLGFIRDVLTGNPTPSSIYDINTVSISETFNPLFGVNTTLLNNLSFNAQMNRSRVLNLNLAAYQIVESLQNEFIIGTGYRINEFNRILGIHTKKTDGFNNDLTIKADLSKRTNQALIRKIEENFTQPTSGNTIITLMVSMDYSLSRALTLRAFFDRVMNNPLVSTSYPTTNTNFGISVRYTLLQ